jgi:hypothetical protein
VGLTSILVGIIFLVLDLIRLGFWYLPYIILFIGIVLILWHYIEQWRKKKKSPQFPCTPTESVSNNAKNNQSNDKSDTNKWHDSCSDQDKRNQSNNKANRTPTSFHNTPPRGK